MKIETKTNGATPGKEFAPIDRTLAAEASSAHSRINLPLNLHNWKHLPPETQDQLLWFHQWILDNDLDWKAATAAIGYEKSSVYKILKGFDRESDSWKPNWPNITEAIKRYRRQQRKLQQDIEFAENRITRVIFDAFEYARANNCITVVETESRMGKTVCGIRWQQTNNHGKTVFATAPVIGGVAAFVRRVGHRCGISTNRPVNDIASALYRAFNSTRHLIIDEAHRLLPNDVRVVNPQKVEFVRDLHDETGCAVTLLVTGRFRDHVQRGAYQYEQLVGRSKLYQVKPTITPKDIAPIVKQFVAEPTSDVMEQLVAMANKPGRLGVVTEVLRMARRSAEASKEKKVQSAHVIDAIALRAEHAGAFAT
ncbi:MAG: AAA family ATPase [Bryobacteraceae bacterium]